MVTALSLVSCDSGEIWGIPISVFRTRIESGEYAFLQHIDYQKIKLREVKKLNLDAPYYFYFIFNRIKLKQLARKMAEIEWKDGKGWYKVKAGLLLLKDLLEEERYEDVISISDKLLRLLKGFSTNTYEISKEVTRARVEAFYWLKRDKKVLKLLSREKKYLPMEGDAELRLFQAVSSFRVEGVSKPERWKGHFKELFFGYQSSFVHSRAYAFLRKNNLLEPYFNEWERDVFTVRDLMGRGQNSQAVETMEKFLAEHPAEASEYVPELVKELGFLYLSLSKYSKGGIFLEKVSSSMSGEGRLYAMEMAGRNFRKAKQYRSAIPLLEEVLLITKDPLQYDRVLWFILDMKLHLNSDDFLNSLRRTYAHWNNPAYFEDLLDKYITELVERRDWPVIYELFRMISVKGPYSVRFRTGYIVNRVVSLGLFKLTTDELKSLDSWLGSLIYNGKSDKSGSIVGKETAVSRNSLYYIMLLYKNNKSLYDLSSGVYERQLFSENSVKATRESSWDFQEKLIEGYFDFGLSDEVYREAMKGNHTLSYSFLSEVATKLQVRDMFRESLNIIRKYLSEKGLRPDKKLAMLYYPRAFIEAVDNNAEKFELPPYILFSLIREESHFDNRIKSVAGAVGLTQLLPATGEDMAKRLRIDRKNLDLYDPVLNITLGSKHLSDLYNRLKSIPKALIAYNAGLKRLRQWEKLIPGLPDDLFVEAIPYGETRSYVKKILLSALYYSLLYYDKKAIETLEFFYE